MQTVPARRKPSNHTVMKLKTSLLSAGACAALLLSLNAQTAGTGGAAGASGTTAPGGASGTAAGSTANAGATGTSANPTAPIANSPTANTLPGTTGLPPTNTDTSAAISAGTRSDASVTGGTSSSVMIGAPATGVPGANSRVSPGTEPIGPLAPTGRVGVTNSSTNIVGGDVEIPRTPPSNPAFEQPNNVIPNGTADVRAQRDTLGTVAAVSAPNPPPAAPAETVPVSPGQNYQWVPGHFTLTNGQWNWMRGTWVVPPSNGAVWVDGRYDPATRRWTPGHWEPGASTSP